MHGSTSPIDARALYIDLLKKCLANLIYDDDLDLMRGRFGLDPHTRKLVAVEPASASTEQKYGGKIWPSRAHTMIGIPRLENILFCVERILAEGVPGDLIEAGVWRGGASIFMRGILKAHGVTDRRVWVADSFRGLPPEDPDLPNRSPLELHRFAQLAVPLPEVRDNFRRYGLLDGQVHFLEGWFEETLPAVPVERLAVLRVDCDLYGSTMTVLEHLYDKVSPGGFVIIDDYDTIEACNAAVVSFRTSRRITTEMVPIADNGAFWRKEV